MLYTKHKDIPLEYRRPILEETLEKRIAKVPISVCNEIIRNYLEEESENETLKKYEVESVKNGVHNKVELEGRQRALVECDRILEFGEADPEGIYIAVRQAGRIIAGYANGEWVDVPSKDKLIVKQRRH